MKAEQAQLGRRIRTLIDFSGVPQGTEGVIDQDYGSGVMVAWDLLDRPLPAGYREFAGGATALHRILRDGFNKVRELHHLELVGS